MKMISVKTHGKAVPVDGGNCWWIVDDSFVVLPTIEDSSFDIVIADPPYDLNEDQKLFLHEQFLRISRGAVIVFSPPENQWIHPADQYLFWKKPISTKNTSRRYSRFVEMIFVYRETVWNSGRHWSQYTNVFDDLVDNSKLHPFRKPPSLIERLIRNHTDEQMTILDPFAGSGVIQEVALRTYRHCISIEKDEKYCENSLD
jgi:DNA modification methylase